MFLMADRCGNCNNCKKLERVKSRVLACANPPFSHADDDVVNVWNTELAQLPCLEKERDPPVPQDGV